MPLVPGRDAAFAEDIGDFSGVVTGYFGGPDAFNVWSETDWQMFRRNRKCPTWVCGENGEDEGAQALNILHGLGVPQGCCIMADMENRRNITMLTAFGKVMQQGGYKVLVYGSRSTVFQNPRLNGYVVADWTGQEHMATNPETGNSIGIRATQWAADVPPGYDINSWKEWALRQLWL